MEDFTNTPESELRNILSAPTDAYTDKTRQSAVWELARRREELSRSTEGGLEHKPYGVSGMIPLVFGLVLLIVGFLAAEEQYGFAVTGKERTRAQFGSVLMLLLYFVGILTIIYYVLKMKLKYSWIYILLGFVLTKWVLIGLGIYAAATSEPERD